MVNFNLFDFFSNQFEIFGVQNVNDHRFGKDLRYFLIFLRTTERESLRLVPNRICSGIGETLVKCYFENRNYVFCSYCGISKI